MGSRNAPPACLFGAADWLLQDVGAPVYGYYQPDRSFYDRVIVEIRSRLDETALEEARAEGRSMTFEQAVAYALEGKISTA